MEEVNKILRNTIKDKKLHNCYQTLIANDLEYLINLDKPKAVDIAESDKLIRYNKKSKNRQERLKIKELLSTVKLKNQYQEKLDKLLGGTTKIKWFLRTFYHLIIVACYNIQEGCLPIMLNKNLFVWQSLTKKGANRHFCRITF